MSLMSALRRRLRREGGFTLVELMVAISVGSVVMLASFSLLDSSVVLTGKTQNRVDSTQRGRQAMDTITSQLRSQVCPNATTPALVGGGSTFAASDQYKADFWVFTGGGAAFAPERHVIAWDTNSNSIIETDYNQAGTQLRQRTLLAKVRPSATNAPVFTYWAYPTTGGTTPSSQLEPAGGALTASEAASVALIQIAFTVQPDTSARPASTGATPPAQSQTFSDQVFSRTADPDNPNGPQAPVCV
jgi:prepilin-type N-terminal cleavage/methylation domain-containing protein